MGLLLIDMEYRRDPKEHPRFSNQDALPDLPRFQRLTHHRLLVDNRDRLGYPSSNPFEFVVNLHESGLSGFDHVTSVELRSLSFPKIDGEQFVVVEVKELADRELLQSTSPNLSNRAMACVYFDNGSMAPGALKPARGRDFLEQVVTFSPPKRQINKLSISFKTHSGAVVSSSVTGGVTDVSMVLEIVTLGASQLPSSK